MSTTPTANIASKSPQTASRHPEHDSQIPPSHSITPSPAQAHPTSQLTADLTSYHNSAQGPSHHSPPEQDVSTERPSKIRRRTRLANMAAERASSSSDSSSQSGMADNETEAERSQQSERSAPQAATPPKKKRTRTLTTPHQSAVLHALLAKSRFPSTAMREEVGRQIGLSARKVQIWFQNQRQKARRPQAESAPLTRPPQYGPFPIMTPAGPPSSSYPSSSAGGSASEVSHPGPSSAHSAAHEPRGSVDSNPVLAGPGMPGWSPQRGPSSAGEWESPQRAPTSPEVPPGKSLYTFSPRSSGGISPRGSRGPTRNLAPQPAQATHVETSPRLSRTLAPIHFSTLEQRSGTPSYVSATTPFPPQSSPSRAFVNIAHGHDALRPAVEQGSPRSRGIPPPFALQPQPQWDPQTFSPFKRPEFASWSQTSGSSLSSAGSSFSAGSGHDHVSHNVSPSRRFYPPVGDPHHAAPLDRHSHHIIPPRGRRLSTSAPCSRASVSGDGHAGSDNEVGEDS